MGLYCSNNLRDSGFWPTTKNGGFPIDYSTGNSVFRSTFNAVIDQLCPVKTGNLKRSIRCAGTGMSMTAFTECEYADYVEFGTWGRAARPFFTIALQAAYSAAYPEWVASYEGALESEYQYVYDQVRAQCAMNRKQNETFAHNWSHNAAIASIQSQRTYHPISPTTMTI